jgi:tetratricopeptide (TPR) repeat protein
MKARRGTLSAIFLVAALFVLGSPALLRGQTTPSSGKPTSAPTPTPTPSTATPPLDLPRDDGKSSAMPLDTAPVNAEEDAAAKAFQDVPPADATKKIDLGEAFAKKYPNSRYLPVVYSNLTMLYLNTNQVQKMEEVGDKEVALTPTDVQTMAILGQTIPRALSSGADAQKELTKAEDYSKRAIEVTPTISKPSNLTEQQFADAKNVTLAMAHSGLGLIYLKRGKYNEAIPELELSVKLDPTPDPVNYYLLGTANQKGSHFTDAIDAFTKCASTQGSLQQTCKNGAEEAKKLSNTQLSVPR